MWKRKLYPFIIGVAAVSQFAGARFFDGSSNVAERFGQPGDCPSCSQSAQKVDFPQFKSFELDLVKTNAALSNSITAFVYGNGVGSVPSAGSLYAHVTAQQQADAKRMVEMRQAMGIAPAIQPAQPNPFLNAYGPYNWNYSPFVLY